MTATTLVISDLHLGTRVSQSVPLAQLLTTDFDRLILNGDTVDSLNFSRFRAEDWQILERLRTIGRERELVLVRGNHDGRLPNGGHKAFDVLADWLGTPLREEYPLKVGERRYLVLHGDQFDDTMNLTWLGDMADWCYRGIQAGSKRVALWLKGRVKHLGGVVRTVREGAVAHAARHGYHGVITGHTHYWDDQWVGGVHYLNTGCWVDSPCSYVRVQDDSIQLEHWGEPALKPAMVMARSEPAHSPDSTEREFSQAVQAG